MGVQIYFIKIEDEQGNLKNYLRFNNKQKAIQVYEYIRDSSNENESITLMDQEFNPVVPFKEGGNWSVTLYQ
jgi:galactose-1-phosphate uridylyltransferase